MKFTQRKTIMILNISLVFALFMQSNAKAVDRFWPVPPEVQENIVQIQMAGVQHNTSQVPLLIKSLQNPPPITNYDYIPGSAWHNIPTVHTQTTDNLYRLALMQSLARLGALGAVPAIDDIIQTNKDVEVVTYAKVYKARLLAESSISTKGNDTPKQVSLKIERFFQEIHLAPENINGSLAAYQAASMKSKTPYITVDGSSTVISLENVAVREIADIVYRDSFASPSSIPALAGIDFNRDGPSALKMRLAPLSPQQRVQTLIQDLVTRKPSDSGFDAYKMQLLSDAGVAAKVAIAAQLKPTLAVTSPDTRAFASVPGALLLARVYNNIQSDGSVASVLSISNLTDKSATHLSRQQFIMEY